MSKASITPHPSWTPSPIKTSWDDLLEGIATASDWEKKRAQIRSRFLDLLRVDAAPSVPTNLEIETEKEWVDPEGFTIRRIRYNVEADEKAYAYLAIPAGTAPATGFPAVLCIHGTTNWGARQTLGLPPEPGDPHGERRPKGLDYARQLVKSGFVTLSPEHFCCATRLPKEGPYDTATFYRKHPKWSAIGKSTFENHVALNVLSSFSFVNADRLGATGHSLGGHNTIFIAAYDSRVKCIVPNCMGLTFRENPEPLHWSRDYWYVYIPQLRQRFLNGERIECDFHEMMALVAPRPSLDLFSLNDTDVRTQAHRVMLHLKLRELYRLIDAEPAHAFLVLGDGHATPDISRVSLVSWLRRWLMHDGNPMGDWSAPLNYLE